MTRFGLVLAASVALFAAPSFAQTIGSCPSAVGAAPETKPVWVMFDLGSAALHPEAKPAIAPAAAIIGAPLPPATDAPSAAAIAMICSMLAFFAASNDRRI